jgi:hypothetical protein
MKHLLGSIRVAVLSAGVLFGSTALAEATKETPSTDKKEEMSRKEEAPKPEAKPKPKKPGQTEELKKAIDELTKEYKDYLAKPEDTMLRKLSDYYKGTPPEGTTVEDILTVCSGNTISGPAGQQAYVKWQLLSACPMKFEGDQVKLATAAYQKAPPLVPAVAGSPQVKSQLDRAIQGKKVAEVPTEIIDGFKKEQDKVDEANLAIVGYRKALLVRLPSNLDTLMLGFQELVNRLNAGADGKAFGNEVKALASEAKAWATVDAKDGQVPQLLAAVQKLKTYKAPMTYYHPSVSGTANAKWGTYPVDFGKNLDDLETALKEIKSGTGGLKFKDEGKDTKKK